ncbi:MULTISPECIES: phage tail assembly protein [Thalassospira]|uniref:phage tail assembly protein n=1 Tax=Thalassospira TaxID=168934 RepID=UPI00080FF0AF|nr:MULTISPECIES: phage tail assembly protein [Thalassospira]OCK08662.1 Mu-like prophage FluMu protein gp41 [Thalassospira sp. KO164]SEE54548.1 Phage tail assembly chaperone protein, E, or 41 or 14 [Thalassospira permensis]
MFDGDFKPDDIDLDGYVEDGKFGRKILRLDYPITVQVEDGSGKRGETIQYIEFRRPVGRDLDQLEKLDNGKSVMAGSRKFIAGLVYGDAPVTERTFEQMDADDYFRSMAVCFGFFLKPSRKISDQ